MIEDHRSRLEARRGPRDIARALDRADHEIFPFVCGLHCRWSFTAKSYPVLSAGRKEGGRGGGGRGVEEAGLKRSETEITRDGVV